MTLPSSGNLGVNQIFTEFGLGVGSFRRMLGQAGAPSSGNLSVRYFLGKGGYLDTQTVTSGYYNNGTGDGYYEGENWGLSYTGYRSSAPSFGSISDGTSNIFSGAAITQLYSTMGDYTGNTKTYLAITGATNTGWTNMIVNGTTLTRASATFSSGRWTWTGSWIPFNTTNTVYFT